MRKPVDRWPKQCQMQVLHYCYLEGTNFWQASHADAWCLPIVWILAVNSELWLKDNPGQNIFWSTQACSPRQMDITDQIWSIWYTVPDFEWMSDLDRKWSNQLSSICPTHQTTFNLTAGDDNLAVSESESKRLKPCNMQSELERLEQLVELKLSKPRHTDFVSVSIQTLVKTMIAEAAWRPLRA